MDLKPLKKTRKKKNEQNNYQQGMVSVETILVELKHLKTALIPLELQEKRKDSIPYCCTLVVEAWISITTA